MQVGLGEARLVLHREPDRLERREGEGAALALELLERGPGSKRRPTWQRAHGAASAGEDGDERR